MSFLFINSYCFALYVTDILLGCTCVSISILFVPFKIDMSGNSTGSSGSVAGNCTINGTSKLSNHSFNLAILSLSVSAELYISFKDIYILVLFTLNHTFVLFGKYENDF